jgi:hypothetical protein
MVDLVPIDQAAKLLKVHPNTLRRHETSDGRWCCIYGGRIRVYRLSNEPGPAAQRRYDRSEIVRFLSRLQRDA